MNYSKNIILYRDRPKYGLVVKLILVIPAALLVGGLSLYFLGEIAGSLPLLLEAFIIGLLFWLIFPREYQVYEDHLSIVLGGPFSVTVGFANIKVIKITCQTGFAVNFATRITKNHVEIVKGSGWSIAITPSNNASFVDNANKALEQWLKARSIT